MIMNGNVLCGCVLVWIEKEGHNIVYIDMEWKIYIKVILLVLCVSWSGKFCIASGFTVLIVFALFSFTCT